MAIRVASDNASLNASPEGPIVITPSTADVTQVPAIADDNQRTPSDGVPANELEPDVLPVVPSVLETPPTVNNEDGTAPLLGDANDPAIYVNQTNPDESRVIVTLEEGGLAVFNLQGDILQTIVPADFGDSRYSNVDLLYDVELPAFTPSGSFTADIAVVSDRANDSLALFAIDPRTGLLRDITLPMDGGVNDPAFSIFGVDDGDATALGLATYKSPDTGQAYAFVTQANGNQVAQLELVSGLTSSPREFMDGVPAIANAPYLEAQVVRTLELPTPTGNPADSQAEAIVVDQALGTVYVALENQVGILKFDAEPNGDSDVELVQPLDADGLEPNLEGLTLYYGDNGTGYLIASSQGNDAFAVFERQGDNAYLGSFAIGETGLIDPVNASDGLDVTNVGLGSAFPNGLLVVQDGASNPQTVADPGEELPTNSTNFKFVDWAEVANAFEPTLAVDTTSYDPRSPEPLINVSSGRNEVIEGTDGDDLLEGGPGNDTFVLRQNEGIDTITNFELGADQIILGSGLQADSMRLFEAGDSTLILTPQNELLGILDNVVGATETIFA